MTVFTPNLPAKLGKYRVLGLLGEGSMGTVFLAHDPVLERNVAVKVMSRSSLGDNRLQIRFEREAKAVARLHHPNIVTVHDLGHDDKGSPFIAMELLEGADLHDLAETRALRLEEKLEIVMQVCRGLEHAHAAGIVHRDIKPANIFVTHDGAAKIMDFGVSRWMQANETQAGLVVGTAGYISPEQLRGKPVDQRADLFSLGVVLFEILTREVLFGGDTIEVIFFKTLVRECPILIAPRGGEVPALQSILRKALAKDADARYRTAEEMETDLRSFASAHRSLLKVAASFSTQERKPLAPEVPAASPKGPTRVLPARATMTIPPSARHRPAGRSPGPRPRRRSRRAPAFAIAVIVFAGSAAAVFYATRVVPPAAPDPAQAPAPVRQPASLLADAALALGRGNVREAAELVERGEKAEPGNPRWGELREQLRAKEAEAEGRRLAARLVEEGRRSLEKRERSRAVGAFTRAVEADPGNEDARKGLERALALAKEPPPPPRSVETPPPAPPRRYIESRTEFLAGSATESELLGFEAEPGIEVGETTDPFFPAQIVLELSPPDARPGQSYTLAVSLFNEGFRPIEVRSLELVSRFGEKTSGKGQPIALAAVHVPPQSTTRLYEVSGLWREAFDDGEIEATVTLVSGGRLVKSLRWEK